MRQRGVYWLGIGLINPMLCLYIVELLGYCYFAWPAADYPLVAHNASFDRKFWDDAIDRQGKQRQQEFLCSMLMARRVFPDAPNHKLGTLVDYLRLPMTGQFHRALADAEATAHLFIRLHERIQQRLNCPAPSCSQLLAVQRQKTGTF